MRLLQIMASNKRGGAEAFFTRLSVALAAEDLEQQVVIRRDAPCRDDLRAGGVAPVTLPFLFRGDMFTRMRLRQLIDDFDPAIVLTWMSRATATCPPGKFVHVARLGGYYDLKYYRACNHLVANTEDIVRYLLDHGWPAERACYLPNFVDEQPVAAADRASLATPPDAPVFLALGRLHSDKAFDVLLAAMALVPQAILWLAGEGPLDGALKAQAANLGIAERVRFLGWRTDGAALLTAADSLVCPSRVEPLGNVILEGWLRGKPVVAAASAGPKGLINHGHDGLLVPMEDAPALADAMRRVIADRPLAQSLAANGHATYRARFGQAAVVARYLDFFATVRR